MISVLISDFLCKSSIPKLERRLEYHLSTLRLCRHGELQLQLHTLMRFLRSTNKNYKNLRMKMGFTSRNLILFFKENLLDLLTSDILEHIYLPLNVHMMFV